MGSSGSKAARSFPKRPEPPAWAAKRTTNPAEPLTGVTAKEQMRHKLASERRTEEIEKDARDPDFLANLNRLGPVRVDHHMKTIRPEATSTTELFKSRQELEKELETNTTLTPNAHLLNESRAASDKFYSSTLRELLDIRKGTKDRADMDVVVKEYGVRLDKLESVARFVSSPSVGKSEMKRTVDRDGNERVVMKAMWVEPAHSDMKAPSP